MKTLYYWSVYNKARLHTMTDEHHDCIYFLEHGSWLDGSVENENYSRQLFVDATNHRTSFESLCDVMLLLERGDSLRLNRFKVEPHSYDCLEFEYIEIDVESLSMKNLFSNGNRSHHNKDLNKLKTMVHHIYALRGCNLSKLKIDIQFVAGDCSPAGEMIEDNCGERTWKVIK